MGSNRLRARSGPYLREHDESNAVSRDRVCVFGLVSHQVKCGLGIYESHKDRRFLFQPDLLGRNSVRIEGTMEPVNPCKDCPPCNHPSIIARLRL